MSETDAECTVEVAEVDPYRGHILEVTGWLSERGPEQFEPDEVRARLEQRVVEVLFHREPAGVLAWAKALSGDGQAEWLPENRHSVELRQVVVEAVGVLFGWRVELRHVHTDPSGAGRTVKAVVAAPVASLALPDE